uniref:Uncharacterized protein n=1 Tax=Chlamydomonas euryale TaxID=1486919 RepID=A0A7R9VNI1_9CHLO|mmetsp:Transcript_39720/g.118201  ORF Transcript_39720/g.118201 Transcript_39720/m.118201 type:complete len:219 (+) Transcript_39720:1428-2084(+)
MEAKICDIGNENKRLRAMLEQLSRDNGLLRGRLGLPADAQLPESSGGYRTSTEPAALVFIATLLLLCCTLPSDQALVLGSAAPLLLLATLAAQSPECRQSAADAFIQFLANLHTLLGATGMRRLSRSVARMLYRRHYTMGKSHMARHVAWARRANARGTLPQLPPRLPPLSPAVSSGQSEAPGVVKDEFLISVKDEPMAHAMSGPLMRLPSLLTSVVC